MRATDEPLHTAAIVGLGYVGVPLALLFVKKGFCVIGIDINGARVDSLQNGHSYLTDITDEDLHAARRSGRFYATTNFEDISNADAVILCVPTPLADGAKPDLHFLSDAAVAIRPFVRTGQLVVLESSTYPGTTEEVLVPLLAESGLKIGEELFVAYSPERIDPGSNRLSVEEIPKVVSGYTEKCRTRIIQLYSAVFKRVVPVANTRTAEMVKVVENAQRFINISFANELRQVCRACNIDVWEVVEAAGTKPFGFTIYYPGPGIGGHCIPIDPLYLKWKANLLGVETPFIDLAHQVNESMPAQVVDSLAKALGAGTLHGKQVFVVGVTYKRDVNDVRESPALAIISLLMKRGATVAFYDPFVETIQIGDTALTRTPLAGANLEKTDAALILTDHTGVDYSFIVSAAPLVVDTRNATKHIANRPNVVFL